MYDFSVSGDELAFRGGDMMIAADDILDGWWMDEAGAVSPSYTDVGPDTMQLPEDFSAFPLIGTSPSTSGTLPAAALPSSRAQRRRSHTASGKGSRLPTTVACNYCLGGLRNVRFKADNTDHSCSSEDQMHRGTSLLGVREANPALHLRTRPEWARQRRAIYQARRTRKRLRRGNHRTQYPAGH
ncbi:hypothetical protein C8R47DRAFT_224780 [Mycena vitilis]|nr:hypothetical protein C8R47DRAFT_224780 [Mycena vitilis]